MCKVRALSNIDERTLQWVNGGLLGALPHVKQSHLFSLPLIIAHSCNRRRVAGGEEITVNKLAQGRGRGHLHLGHYPAMAWLRGDGAAADPESK